MLRSILGIVGGILVAGFSVGMLEMVGHLIFPPPAGMDPNDFESIKEHLPNLPVGVFVSVLVAWSVGFCSVPGSPRLSRGDERSCMPESSDSSTFLVVSPPCLSFRTRFDSWSPPLCWYRRRPLRVEG